MTRIADLLDAGRTFSFEFFPPKNDVAERQLEKALFELAPLRPSFVSVTYGQLGSTRDRTRDIVLRVERDFDFPCMAHLTCVGHTREQVVELLEEYREGDVENILALAGDPPADGSDPGGEFTYAVDLVDLVREVDGFSVGVAAHPEVHPRSPDRPSDRRYMAEKLARADFGITQFFFHVEDYLQMVDELAEYGCDTPVLAGVMPITSVKGIKKMAAMNASKLPDALIERLETVADDPDEVAKIGVEVATDIASRLIDEGAPGIHFYALNKSDSIRAIYDNLGLA